MFSLFVVGFIKTPFRERNGTPRQSLLAPAVRSTLKILPQWHGISSLDGLESFSHCWVVFLFDRNTNEAKRSGSESMVQTLDPRLGEPTSAEKSYSDAPTAGLVTDTVKQPVMSIPAKVSPPRLGGKKVGLFATRTPHRPNPIGLSLARIERLDLLTGTLHLSGLDLCDGTAVLDIKPYHPQDRIESAKFPEWVLADTRTNVATEASMNELEFASWVSDDAASALSMIEFKPSVNSIVRIPKSVILKIRGWQPNSQFYSATGHRDLYALVLSVAQVLACEIRPVHVRKQRSDQTFGLWFDCFNFLFRTNADSVDVADVELWIDAKQR
ncbi:mitochondrial S-adenosylmethionine-dependent tRNAThr(GGU) m6t6A37 methyltransferase (Tsa/YaeB) [Andalucia godoyi]|uniref:Mitochondrial S-adenosylmethionine-dependent tRNAThr(GGU) m6t6A37 methyltransferase (Tsa/YaeB) n=1 Tax=Andalucia godoyi TaxID=505711 RepID=A0A8K0F2T2_ANDGO|nr:mitochondrial S-adenosylmethionine-dependent tRNAThr(GGU) m6t6A37 methyltransferase (Tsa/YaeB) [Andalucia godoyi]|eukprot:ANDGO_05658.mRNA.1 mitochondrial S-adenosylmethionine-dependent tRNAThr(GGU) m6t6A37 methyltransferase (Tsa/YaeB)